tara:strand:- start:135 stop:494 length:360 start_codon:yes stop_codon:yes gene_type:complete
MDTLIPISLFLMIALIIVTPVYLTYLSRVKELETLSKLAESNVEERAELLKLIQRPSLPRNDLRKGLILLAIALPIIVGGLVDGSVMVSIVLGGIPLLIGLAFVYMAKSAEPTPREMPN